MIGRERRLALVVTTAPEHGDFELASELARAARAAGVDVAMFFMDDAVAGLPANAAALAALAADDCTLIACAHSATARGLGAAELAGVVLGSQDDHAAIVHRADRVMAFT